MYQQILTHTLIPSIKKLHSNGKYVFQQDNAPCHTAMSTVTWFIKNHIPIIDNWLPQSPDMNPIENLWDYIDRQVRQQQCRTHDELWEAVQKVWQSIPLLFVQKLINSMPNRLQELCKNCGGSIKY